MMMMMMMMYQDLKSAVLTTTPARDVSTQSHTQSYIYDGYGEI